MDVERMKKSFNSLLRTPNNNLSVFCDSNRILPGNIDLLCFDKFGISFAQIMCNVLLNDPILPRIKYLQQITHQDIHQMAILAQQIPFDTVTRVISQESRQLIDCINSQSPVSEIYRLIFYLISMTIKDISIMIRIKPVQDNQYSFTVNVIDLDLKTYSNLYKNEQLQAEFDQ
jgi:hypothetical protein